jgi:uncharacterized OB-fold protein
MSTGSDSLVAHHVLEFPGGYRRSVGPVVGRFLGALRAAKILGVRAPDGRVLVPPPEWDPQTGAALGDDFVEVGPGGTVVSWTWVTNPTRYQPLDQPFAYALLLLDGADTPMLHIVDTSGDEDALATGLRVTAVFAPGDDHERDGDGAVTARFGSLLDLARFVPEGVVVESSGSADDGEPVQFQRAPIRLDYEVGAGTAQSKFLRGLAEGRFLGQRSEVSGDVYMPPRGSDPKTGTPTHAEVECGPNGTVTTFCVVNLQFHPDAPPAPYTCAQVLLDGANTPLFGLVGDIPTEDTRMGLRVKAVWKPKETWGPTLENIKWFAPNGEDDASYESYKDYL